MSDSNVGLGMVSCRKGCRCDDCTIERLTAQVKYVQECNGRQYKRIAELEAARVIVSRWYCENCGCQECLAAEAALEVDDE